MIIKILMFGLLNYSAYKKSWIRRGGPSFVIKVHWNRLYLFNFF